MGILYVFIEQLLSFDWQTSCYVVSLSNRQLRCKHTIHTQKKIVYLHKLSANIYSKCLVAKCLEVKKIHTLPAKRWRERESVYREVQVCLTLHISAIATRNTGNDASPYRRKGHLTPSATEHTLRGGPGWTGYYGLCLQVYLHTGWCVNFP